MQDGELVLAFGGGIIRANFDAFRSAGVATQAIRVTVPVTGDLVTTEVTIDHVVVRNGRSTATITFSSSAAATPVETIDEVTALIAERLPS